MSGTTEEMNIELLEFQIGMVKTALDSLMSSRMKKKTVLILLSHYSGLPQKTVKLVLEAIENAGTEYFGEEG